MRFLVDFAINNDDQDTKHKLNVYTRVPILLKTNI